MNGSMEKNTIRQAAKVGVSGGGIEDATAWLVLS